MSCSRSRLGHYGILVRGKSITKDASGWAWWEDVVGCPTPLCKSKISKLDLASAFDPTVELCNKHGRFWSTYVEENKREVRKAPSGALPECADRLQQVGVVWSMVMLK